MCVIVLICGALITLTAAKEKNPNIKRVEREREPLMKGCEDDEGKNRFYLYFVPHLMRIISIILSMLELYAIHFSSNL